MADQVPAVCDVLATIEARDWERLGRILHLEIHWTTAVEEHVHGPGVVVACLEGDPPRRPRPTMSSAKAGWSAGSTRRVEISSHRAPSHGAGPKIGTVKVGTPFGEFPFEFHRLERRGRGIAAVGTVAGVQSSVVIGPEDVGVLAKRVAVPLAMVAFVVVKARTRSS